MAKRVLVIIFCVILIFFVSSGVLRGAVFNVSTASELQNALTAAQSNGEDDIIRVAQGTYIGIFPYQSDEQGKSITLLGGYTAGFASRVINPSNTILDADGAGPVLMISNYANGGDIFIEGFTVKGGKSSYTGGGIYVESVSSPPNTSGSGKITLANNIITENFAGDGYGGGAYVRSYSASGPAGDVQISACNILKNNCPNVSGGGICAISGSSSLYPSGDVIFSGNFISGNAGRGGGGVYAVSETDSGLAGNIVFTNNIVVDNTASINGGGASAASYSSLSQAGVVTFVNNTITGNSSPSQGSGARIDTIGDGGTANVYNNIIWGNMVSEDIWIAASPSNGYNNDYSEFFGYWGDWTNSGGNIDADPQFIGGDDYHLKSSSPCIDMGTNSAPEIPASDFDGDPRIADGDHDNTATVDMGADEYYVSYDDFIGTWDSQGVYYKNSETGNWIKLASPADLIAAGDLDGDYTDDLIGIWPTQGGVWANYSKTGSWAKLSSTATHVGSGDMNGDGRKDLLGTWDGQGVYYRDSISGVWVKLASPATLITAGDLDGDNKDDLIGIWPTQGGVWVKYSKIDEWGKLSTTARDIAAGDMNGDGRDDLLATWDGQGVYYRDSITGSWVKMATPADQVTCGDIDEDGTEDLIGIWSGQGGVWVKYSKTGSWAKLSASAKDIATGLMRGGAWGSGVTFESLMELAGPFGGYAEGPLSQSGYIDLSAEGPRGSRFAAKEETNLIPQVIGSALAISGPGEPGFICVEEANLVPREEMEKNAARRSVPKDQKK
jgi:hypothetical protein